MGTTFPEGKPENRVTISKSSGAARQVNPDTGKVDRSFAQPNPAIEHPELEPKAEASAQDQVEALNENSKKGREYSDDDTDGTDGSDPAS